MPLDERKYRILQAIIDDYILTAMPVGSRTLSRKSGIGLSSATIRNEMSDLEEMGYLDQPHTSAGRVPSLLAFRLYVDRLMRVAALGKEEREYIRAGVGKSTQMLEDVLNNTAQVLSDVTDYAAAVLAPQAREVVIRHVQLVPVTQDAALVVVVTSAGVLKDALVQVPVGTTSDMLQMISNALTAQLKNKTAAQIPAAMQQISQDIYAHRQFAEEIVGGIAKSAQRAEDLRLVLGGRANLLKHPEFSDVENIRGVLSALEPRGTLAGIMSQRAQMEFSISIGPELGSEEMKSSSLVTVSYHMGDTKVGTVGIIGPVRMDYARVAAILMQMQKTLNDMFNS